VPLAVALLAVAASVAAAAPERRKKGAELYRKCVRNAQAAQKLKRSIGVAYFGPKTQTLTPQLMRYVVRFLRPCSHFNLALVSTTMATCAVAEIRGLQYRLAFGEHAPPLQTAHHQGLGTMASMSMHASSSSSSRIMLAGAGAMGGLAMGHLESTCAGLGISAFNRKLLQGGAGNGNPNPMQRFIGTATRFLDSSAVAAVRAEVAASDPAAIYKKMGLAMPNSFMSPSMAAMDLATTSSTATTRTSAINTPSTPPSSCVTMHSNRATLASDSLWATPAAPQFSASSLMTDSTPTIPALQSPPPVLSRNGFQARLIALH